MLYVHYVLAVEYHLEFVSINTSYLTINDTDVFYNQVRLFEIY